MTHITVEGITVTRTDSGRVLIEGGRGDAKAVVLTRARADAASAFFAAERQALELRTFRGIRILDALAHPDETQIRWRGRTYLLSEDDKKENPDQHDADKTEVRLCIDCPHPVMPGTTRCLHHSGVVPEKKDTSPVLDFADFLESIITAHRDCAPTITGEEALNRLYEAIQTAGDNPKYVNDYYVNDYSARPPSFKAVLWDGTEESHDAVRDFFGEGYTVSVEVDTTQLVIVHPPTYQAVIVPVNSYVWRVTDPFQILHLPTDDFESRYEEQF